MEAADKLRSDCENSRMPHWIEVIPTWGSEKNERTIYKPTFIRKMLANWDRPIMWIDADSRLLDHMKVKQYGSDVGLMPNPFGSRNNLLFSSGAIWFNPTQASFDFLRMWESMCSGYWHTGFGDHYYLIKAIGLHLHMQETSFRLLLEQAEKIVLNGGYGLVPKRLVCEIQS